MAKTSQITTTFDRIELTLLSRTWKGEEFEQTFSTDRPTMVLIFKPLGADEQLVTLVSVEEAELLEAATRDGRLPDGEWDDMVLDFMWESLLVDEVGELLERWSPEGRAAKAEYLSKLDG